MWKPIIATAAFFALTAGALAGGAHPDRGTLNPAATPEILRVDAAILATGVRVPDLSDMRHALPN